MKHQETNKKIGIWLDHEQAKLIEPGQTPDKIQTVTSNIESRVRISGEVADGTRLGNFRSTNNESHKHNKENNEIHAYYKGLADVLRPYDEIFIFGPTTAHKELHNILLEEKHFAGKRIFAESDDYLTENQIVERVNKNYL